MAAVTKKDLLNVTQNEFAKLTKLLANVDADLAARTYDAVTIKDIVAHRAHWIGLFLGWYAKGQQGEPVDFPATGYKWSELNRYNADLRASQRHMTWDEARSALESAHGDLLTFLRSKSNHALYGGPMKGAKNDWTTGRWAEAAGASHYRSAAKAIRAGLRATHFTPT